MVKAYLRYVPHKTLSLLHTGRTPIAFVKNNPRFILSAALEAVLLIDWRTSEVVATFLLNPGGEVSEQTPSTSVVTAFLLIEQPAPPDYLLVGYSNGLVAQFDFTSKEVLNTYWLHKSEVLSLAAQGSLLASGGADCSIILYDLLSAKALKKLKGQHSNSVFSLFFISPGRLLSVGKDNLVKLWNIEESRCVATAAEVHRGNLSAATYIPRPWNLIVLAFSGGAKRLTLLAPPPSKDFTEFQQKGEIKLPGDLKIGFLQFSGDSLLSIDAESTLGLWRLVSDEELAHRLLLARRRSKGREEGAQSAKEKKVTVKQEKKQIQAALASRSFDHSFLFKSQIWATNLHKPFSKLSSGLIAGNNHILLASPDNAVRECARVEEGEGELKLKEIKTLSRQAHATGVRSVAMSDNDRYLVSASNQSTLIWETESFYPIHCLPTHLVSAVAVLPGSGQVVCGTRSGELLLYSLNSAEQLSVQKHAHLKEIWSLQCHASALCNPKAVSILSASADATLKIWSVGTGSGKKQALGLVLLETIKLTDEATCAGFSPSGKLIAVALLDNTIQLLHADSKKLYLPLFAHALPVLTFDISSDDALLVSGSADKTIKLWGVDFGDVHRSLLAHSEPVTCVRFVPNTHYFFSASRDGFVKYFDADTAQEVMVFDFHFAEVWGLALSSLGDQFVSCSADKSIRVFQQTSEQVFAALEKRKREEQALFSQAQNALEEVKQGGGGELARPTPQNIKYGEGLIEAVAKAEAFRGEVESFRMTGGSRPQVPFEFGGLDAFGFILHKIQEIRSPDLEGALSYLSFADTRALLFYLEHLLRTKRGDTARVVGVTLFLLKTHQTQLIATQSLAQILLSIASHLKKNLKSFTDTLGFNLAVLGHVQGLVKE